MTGKLSWWIERTGSTSSPLTCTEDIHCLSLPLLLHSSSTLYSTLGMGEQTWIWLILRLGSGMSPRGSCVKAWFSVLLESSGTYRKKVLDHSECALEGDSRNPSPSSLCGFPAVMERAAPLPHVRMFLLSCAAMPKEKRQDN